MTYKLDPILTRNGRQSPAYRVHCGKITPNIQGAERREELKMICPKCAGETEIAAYDEVKVDRCTQCGGLWFDSGELEELRQDNWMADYVLDTGDAKLGKRFNRVDHIHCPRCNALMNEEFDADQPHIMYERCPEGHGTFLDAGEFTDLVHKTFWDRFKRLA